MIDETRIRQFRTMTEADPNNELGHFSLGKAYADTGGFAEAVGPLTRAVELNARMSKAYQLLGEAYERTGQHEKAVEVMTRGVTVADEQGDRVPRDAMVKALTEWGAPVPTLKETAGAQPAGQAEAGTTSGFACARCGRPTGRLEKAPFKGSVGQKIHDNVCATCWREWIGMGTKVINELGLVLSTQAGQQTYDQHMLEFLQLEGR